MQIFEYGMLTRPQNFDPKIPGPLNRICNQLRSSWGYPPLIRGVTSATSLLWAWPTTSPATLARRDFNKTHDATFPPGPVKYGICVTPMAASEALLNVDKFATITAPLLLNTTNPIRDVFGLLWLTVNRDITSKKNPFIWKSYEY